MFRKLYSAILLVFLATISTTSQAEDFTPVDEYLASWESDDAPGLAVAISRNGETVYRGNFGLANLEHNLPVTDDTRFHIASVSKQFTAFAIMPTLSRMTMRERITAPELQVSYVMEAVDGELVLSEPHASKLPMRGYQSDTFKPLGPTYVGRMKFTRDAVGKVNCVLVSGPLANDIILRRIELPAN